MALVRFALFVLLYKGKFGVYLSSYESGRPPYTIQTSPIGSGAISILFLLPGVNYLFPHVDLRIIATCSISYLPLPGGDCCGLPMHLVHCGVFTIWGCSW